MTTEKPEKPDASTSEFEQRAARDTRGAAEKVQHDLEAVTEKASEEAEAIKRQASDKFTEAEEQAKSFASDQKKLAASQITEIASAISKVADELEEKQGTTARYARDLARGLDRFGSEVEDKSVDELIGNAQKFGRAQPLVFFGAAALAGFVASRFAGASAQRSQHKSGASQTSVKTPSGAAYGRTSAGNDEGTDPASAYGRSSNDLTGDGNVPG